MEIEKILIADDHELILTAICGILINKLGISKDSIDLFTSSEKVLRAINHTDYDLYILDLEFKRLSGFDLIDKIREKDKHAKIIVCTMHREIWNVNRLLERDINGIIVYLQTNVHH